ncbi:GNAT family N-acetyltransferase [Peribacillus kribbensis]|uniref:GNAT family N-acetyltransferase n=1 Tax=Peribacillus kribbensis TaxID=356658 RepID=UPI000422D7F9|nr:GNAT family N-acetyltransferase [Peribacillus kribbensis]
MDIQKGKNSFFIGNDENNPTAEVHFEKGEGNELVVDHTFVSEDLRGQGVGEKLFQHVVEYARENQHKIIPLCSFARKQFESHSEYQDLLAQ